VFIYVEKPTRNQDGRDRLRQFVVAERPHYFHITCHLERVGTFPLQVTEEIAHDIVPVLQHMNPATQRRHGFTVETLPSSSRASHKQLYAVPNGQELHDAFEERLRDNTTTPVPDQVQFRVEWLRFCEGTDKAACPV
jgi:hypothetical protein